MNIHTQLTLGWLMNFMWEDGTWKHYLRFVFEVRYPHALTAGGAVKFHRAREF
jgi:hypothetical protein